MKDKRYALLDGLRGFALLNMLVYHAVWDLVYMFGFDWAWYKSDAAYLWQQGICWTFILLSGFCHPLGKHPYRRGLMVSLAGLLITTVTLLAMPENRVVFGILTLLGTCMLLLGLLQPLLKRCPPEIGILLCMLLFFFTRHIADGYLGFGNLQMINLPASWYRSLLTAFIGMPAPSFYSTDYFALFPWMFLYATGYYIDLLVTKKELLTRLTSSRIKPIEWVGQRSLLIYILHQPLIYLAFLAFFEIVD